MTGTGINDGARYHLYIQESNLLLVEGGEDLNLHTHLQRDYIQVCQHCNCVGLGKMLQRQLTLMNQGGPHGGGDAEVLKDELCCQATR